MLQDLLPEFAVEPQMHRPPRRALIRFLLRPVMTWGALAALAAFFIPYGWLAFALPNRQRADGCARPTARRGSARPTGSPYYAHGALRA